VFAPTAAAPVIILDIDEAVTGVHVTPPFTERANIFVASVLFPATHTPFEYTSELHTGNGTLTAFDASTVHVLAVIALGRDDRAKTLSPLPPTIQSGAPVPCDPARPYATVSADAPVPVNGVIVVMMLLY
jgi:hypothetical protein